MPNLKQINFSDDKEFERYVCEYFSLKYGANFTTYGSSGQEQKGIDGFNYAPFSDGKRHVIQCKNWVSKKLKIENILDDLNKTDGLGIEFNAFHFVTSAKKETKLQDDITNNLNLLTKNHTIEFNILYYSDFFDDSLQYESIRNKYFSPLFSNSANSNPVKRDTDNLIMLANFIDSSFINIPFEISNAHSQETPAYSSLSNIEAMNNLLYEGVFYDQKLNDYLKSFEEYIERIDDYRIQYYEFLANMNSPGHYHLRYTGRYEDLPLVRNHLVALVDNFSETFKRFNGYLKNNYYNFDLYKNYYRFHPI
ncbi:MULTISPECIES: hypothetical protein [Pantoea]|uniref:hypothetical protein n=1 Tax=Pantoea TaxID=53335 RepID=UPI000ACB2A45|nr:MULTISPECIES: hypothetical protein [Pantoea]PZD63537.1 hypothetical protein ARC272_11710 [Pantoea ananatis]